MKELFKKTFNNKITTPIFVGLGTFAIFTFIVFPGLTAPSTIFNIVSGVVGLFTLVFVFFYLKDSDLLSEPIIEPGETELDYIPQPKPKRKYTKKPKQ